MNGKSRSSHSYKESHLSKYCGFSKWSRFVPLILYISLSVHFFLLHVSDDFSETPSIVERAIVVMDSFTTEAFTLLSLGVLIVALRTYARWTSVGPRNFMADDYLMLVAVVR